jgi:glucose-6-phosphate-specific signal transduction histidine kinase
MLFTLLSPVLNPEARYNIYLDIKDTSSATKAAKLREVLCNDCYDFDRHLIQRIQPIRSDEVEQLQLCDLLIGAVAYINRELSSSLTKTVLIDHIKKRSTYSLVRSTLLSEKKFNIFRWQGQEAAQ